MQKNLLLKSFNVFLLFCGLLPTRVSAPNTQSGFENLITKAPGICENLDLKLIINGVNDKVGGKIPIGVLPLFVYACAYL